MPTDPSTLPQRRSFSASNPALQIYWDSTSLGELETCPRKYELSILNGWTPRESNIHFTFGILNHLTHEKYDYLRAEGLNHKDAAHEVIKYTFSITWDKEMERPIIMDDPYKNRESLLRTIIWHMDLFQDDNAETIILSNGKPAVELPFRMSLNYSSQLTSEEYGLCGRLDRLVTFNSKHWILDYKTTKFIINEAFFFRFTPDTQVSLYDLAGQNIFIDDIQGVLIDAAQIAKNFTRFLRAPIPRSEKQREEWLADTVYYINQNEKFVASNHWPMNRKACGVPTIDATTGEFRFGCPFRDVCSAAPEMRETILNSKFTKRIWDPLVNREV